MSCHQPHDNSQCLKKLDLWSSAIIYSFQWSHVNESSWILLVIPRGWVKCVWHRSVLREYLQVVSTSYLFLVWMRKASKTVVRRCKRMDRAEPELSLEGARGPCGLEKVCLSYCSDWKVHASGIQDSRKRINSTVEKLHGDQPQSPSLCCVI